MITFTHPKLLAAIQKACPELMKPGPKARNITGQRFGKVVALGVIKRRDGKGELIWLVQCDCGNKKEISGVLLRNGSSQSCGCLAREQAAKRLFTHKMTGTRTHGIWGGMLDRCYNAKSRAYKWYGAKGIKVCQRWHKFENFLADMGEKPTGLSIDRIDPKKGYNPGNCRWADTIMQGNNRTNNKWLSFDGEKHTMAEWARIKKVNYRTLMARINKGWPLKRALESLLVTK